MDYMSAEARAAKRAERMLLETAPGRQDRERSDARLETLHLALYGLSASQREVLVLSRYEDMSYAEIAEVCGTTVGAIKVRAHRAMRALRDRYREMEQAQ